MFHVALWEPEIPPNTGNIARLCAATASRLHLVGKLGFRIDDAAVRRAGLDYWPYVDLHVHATYADFAAALGPARIWLVDCPAETDYTAVQYEPGDCFLFGNEARGFPPDLLAMHAGRTVVIPMVTRTVRSLNLSTSAGIVLYEAIRQQSIPK
ncbi:MAG: tRNA (cytidine(34)-2'-O)-methyltransferase [Gemmataceae bacterium]